MVAEFHEVESGKRADKPQLATALAFCRNRLTVLVIAKMNRLARNAQFQLSMVESSGEAGVIFCDRPTVPAGPVAKSLVAQMAAVSQRTNFGGCSEVEDGERKAWPVQIPNPRARPKLQSTVPPGDMTPATCLPSCCSSAGRHGTSWNPIPSSIMANRPEERVTRWR